jgi:hypothetical protein
MTINAQLATYASGNSSVWHLQTHSGATIQTALDFGLTLNASKTNETPWIPELLQSVGIVALVYGDPQGKYVEQLNQLEPDWTSEGWFLWTQPLNVSTSSGNGTTTGTGSHKNGERRLIGNTHWVVAGLAMLVMQRLAL